MSDGLLARFFWQVVDDLDYLVTLARLRIVDAVAGPEPQTPADQQRERDREQLERAFPEIDCNERDAAISRCADRHWRDD
jgi:hypothetical protein